MPKIERNFFFNPDIDITVPESGIIFTSNKSAKKIVVIDSSQGKAKTLYPGYGIPFADDILKCGNKKYVLDVLVYGNLPIGWDYKADSIKRNITKALACKILNE